MDDVGDTLPPFKYERLQIGEIRLLYAELSPHGSTQWSLKTIALPALDQKDQLEFDALSYTWGNPTEIFTFICNGHKLHVHRNLHEALPYLAARSGSRPMWIDALCINQSDDDEKLVQVRRMDRIYQQASRVWVWLGCGTEHSEAAIVLLPRLAQTIQAVKEAESESTKYTIARNSRLRLESFGLPEASSPIWTAIYDILRNRWFTRLWIVQEFALSREAHFILGHNEIDVKILEHALIDSHLLANLVDVNEQNINVDHFIYSRTVFTVRTFLDQREALSKTVGVATSISRTLLSIVSYMIDTSSCHDPRDRVWGLFGFLNGHQPEELKLDRQTSLPDLYTRLGHYLFVGAEQSKFNLWDLLERATLPGKLPGLPGWCPDFHHHISSYSRIALATQGAQGVDKYQASTSRRSVVQSGTRFTAIRLQGTIFDTVVDVHPAAPVMKYGDHKGRARIVRTFQALLGLKKWDDLVSAPVMKLDNAETQWNATPPAQDKGHSVLDIYWRTLIGNKIKHKSYAFSYESFVEFRKLLAGFAAMADKHDGMLRK